MATKRKETTNAFVPAKKRRTTSTVTVSRTGNVDFPEWPAPQTAMNEAREFIRDCILGKHLTLLVPDKDADGLSSNKIMHQTLTIMGLPKDRIRVHMLAKAASIFQDSELEKMDSYGATRVIVMDQGSRGGRHLVSPVAKTGETVRTLIIDHHESDAFPEGALAVSACRSPPVVTSSLLTYLICLPLHSRSRIRDACAVPALLGVFGDLGSSAVNWNESPWPKHLGDVVKRDTRRTAEYQVHDAWEVVLKNKHPQEISRNPVFINAEVERCTYSTPQWRSSDVSDKDFLERTGGDFAKGHKEATGGIILSSDFEKFVEAMEVGVKPDRSELPKPKKPSKNKVIGPAAQSVKLTDFFSSVK